jgi:hypothetical protein
MVNQRIFLRNSLEEDLLTLYDRLVELGIEYRDGEVYLVDLEAVTTHDNDELGVPS